MPAAVVRPSNPAASLVSVAALARLNAPGRATIHSIHRSAINIALPDGSLIVVADSSLGALPNGVLIDLGPDLRTLGLHTGQLVLTSLRHIDVPEAGLRIELDGATPWSPRIEAAEPRVAGRWPRRSARVRELAWTATAEIAGPRAMGLAGLLCGRQPRYLPVHAARAAAILDQLEAALANMDVEAAGAAGRRLVGLGPGLTPSGDDALVGLAAALQALGHPARGFLVAAIADAGDRTTFVAASLLRHAAAGEFTQRLQRLLAALLGDDDAAIEPAIEQAIAWGATSGTDCLVGVLFGLDVASSLTPTTVRPAR